MRLLSFTFLLPPNRSFNRSVSRTVCYSVYAKTARARERGKRARPASACNRNDDRRPSQEANQIAGKSVTSAPRTRGGGRGGGSVFICSNCITRSGFLARETLRPKGNPEHHKHDRCTSKWSFPTVNDSASHELSERQANWRTEGKK